MVSAVRGEEATVNGLQSGTYACLVPIVSIMPIVQAARLYEISSAS